MLHCAWHTLNSCTAASALHGWHFLVISAVFLNYAVSAFSLLAVNNLAIIAIHLLDDVRLYPLIWHNLADHNNIIPVTGSPVTGFFNM